MRSRYGETPEALPGREAESKAEARVTVDGVVAADGSIPLRDDGRAHAVIAHVWREHGPSAP